MTYKGLEE